jgi:1,6-anhydro-N-acetylmuramate kinase
MKMHLHRLHRLLDHCVQEIQIDHAHEPMQIEMYNKQVRKVVHRKRAKKEFMFNVEIGDLDMNGIILDLGSDVNNIS